MHNKTTNSSNQKPKILATLQQESERTGVPYTSLRALVLKGYLPRVQLGDSRRTWVRPADVDRLISQGCK